MFLRPLATLLVVFLGSCGSVGVPIPNLKPYRIEIQQGNFVSQEMVSKLKPGMSKDQVRFVLGTPLITDSFHADRWDYVFRRQRVNSTELEHRKIAVFFEDGKLKRVEGDVKPAPEENPAGVKLPEAQKAPVGATAAQAKPAAQKSTEAPKPAAASKDLATADVTEKKEPQEKSWWQRLKDKFLK
jgi:outer membrane protein assembly factor BamE